MVNDDSRSIFRFVGVPYISVFVEFLKLNSHLLNRNRNIIESVYLLEAIFSPTIVDLILWE